MESQGKLNVERASGGLPDAASLAALRAWHEGLSAREAVERYLGTKRATGQSSRSMLARIRRLLAEIARQRHRADLVQLFEVPPAQRVRHARSVDSAIEQLRRTAAPEPLIGDPLERWLPPRITAALHAHGVRTLAELTLRVPRRRRWWVHIAGLGHAGARTVEDFFAQHAELTERARALISREAPRDIVPWERLVLPHEVDGSRGTFRAPRATCTLRAANDYQAVQAWLALHESEATQRAYRKEAERLILWAIVEGACPLSSLVTEDAVAYRAFLRNPTPRSRWVGPPRPRSSHEWRPFAGGLSAQSVAYSLSVLGALYRWLIQQRYVLANPFAGLKVRGASRTANLAVERVFSEEEWALIQIVADKLEWSCGWQPAAAQRLRFVLDFSYATGLRASELVGATLRLIEVDGRGDHWITVVGKGSKTGKVALPPLARSALDRYLAQRGLPVTRARWDSSTPLVGSLDQDTMIGITAARLWAVMKRFFRQAAGLLADEHPATAAKLLQASPHWTRHTHGTHALAQGAELTSVRDNMRHASISTTSMYLHGDDAKRAREFGKAFAAR